jgi:hypothetical protein
MTNVWTGWSWVRFVHAMFIWTNVAAATRNVSHHGRKEPATLATPLYNRASPIFENNYGDITIFQRSRILNLEDK